uniref:GRAM domain-containing protein n=1 Tax=Syphacia muris TaxID=451379 RepID=A0A0N5AAQ5_9BILA
MAKKMVKIDQKMNRLAYESLLPRCSETTWTLLKYTQLNGYRKELSPAIGTLFVTVNTVRKYITVKSGNTVLEEVGLIGLPIPIFKSRDKDIFIQTNTKEGTILAKFRIKFISSNDHAGFIELVSHYVSVLVSPNDTTVSCSSQELFSQSSQRFETRFAANDGIKRYSDASTYLSTKRPKNELSNEKLMLSMSGSFSLSQQNDQVVPSFADTSSSTQTTLNETFPEESQVSFERRISMVDEAVQTEPLLCLENLLNDEAMLEHVIYLKLSDPNNKDSLKTLSLQKPAFAPSIQSKEDNVDLLALIEKYSS